MPSKFTPLVFLLLSIVIACNVPAAYSSDDEQAKEYGHVLFVGNSFSFYNNGVHNHFSSLIRANGEWERGKNRVRLATISGGHMHEQLPTIETFLANERDSWQAIVLQAHSNEPIVKSKQKRFAEATTQAIDMIRAKDIEPVLFMTWGYEGDIEMSLDLAKAYLDIGKQHRVKVVPVGLAFALVEQKYPDISLFVRDVLSVKVSEQGQQVLTYRKDIKHPSQAGTYLAALVFYASFYNKSPVGNVFTADLSPQTAQILQEVSWDVVNELRNAK
jgi:hypothetical protein